MMVEMGGVDFGWPQLAAILLLAQRGLEELHSRRNTKRLLAQGGYECGAEYYPVVAITHIGWIAALFFLIPAGTQVYWFLAVLFLASQICRYWIILSLGPYWTHRIITLPEAPIVRTGPYRLLRHPNYAITYFETACLPLCFGAVAIAAIFGAIWWAVVQYKIVLEDQALKARIDSP